MTESDAAAKCSAVPCSQGRLKALIFLAVLCICIIATVLSTKFIIKNGDADSKGSTEAQGPPVKTPMVTTSTYSPVSNATPGTSTISTLSTKAPEINATSPSTTKAIPITSTASTSSTKAPEINATSPSTTKAPETNATSASTTKAIPITSTTSTSSTKATPVTSMSSTSSTKAPGTSTTLTPPSQNATFELSKSYVYIGDTDVQMTCNVSNYPGLTRIEIYHETQRIANITSSSKMVNTSRIILKEGNITNSSSIVRIGFINQIECLDKGRFFCIVTGFQVSNLTLKLDPLRRPTNPVLILSREIVEGKETRVDLPFICEGDVGFPAGDLVLGSNFSSNFSPNIKTVNTTISNETCRAYQKITFFHTFTLNWNGTEILCSAVNNKSLGQNEKPPFDKQLVTVIPATYCKNKPRRQYYHPYNCNYFVDCVNGTVHVGMCPNSQCFGVNETDSCNFCTSSLCVNKVVDTICPGSNAEAIPYSGLRCGMFVNCMDRMVNECPGNECFNVTNKTCPSWVQSMTSSSPVPGTTTSPIPSTAVITFEPSKREMYIGDRGLSMTCNVSNHQNLKRVEISSKLGIIANITQQSNYTYKAGVVLLTGSFVKENNASVKIAFNYNITCNDDGKYDCKAIGNSTTSSSINFTVLSEPNAPALTLSPWIEENRFTVVERMFRCQGMVGKPGSQMFVETNISGKFEPYNFPSNISNMEDSCNTNQSYQFSYSFSMSWHGVYMKCAVKNLRTNELIRSPEKKIEVVPGNYCVSVGTADDNVYPHPYDCGKYIRCSQYGIIGIYDCGCGRCFGVNQTLTGGCTFCNDKDLMCLKDSRKPTIC